MLLYACVAAAGAVFCGWRAHVSEWMHGAYAVTSWCSARVFS